MSRTEKELTDLASEHMRFGLSEKASIAKALRGEGRLEKARWTYLWGVLTRALKRRSRKPQAIPLQEPEDTPLVDDSAPLSFVVSDNLHLIEVSVDRYTFRYRIYLGMMIFVNFSSQISNERLSDIPGNIVSQARTEAENYVHHIPGWRRNLLTEQESK